MLPFAVLSPESETQRYTPRPPPSLAKTLKRVSNVRPDLQVTWLVSDILFALTMFCAPFARSLRFATTVVAVTGIPWAVSCWAPFAFMGVEINRLGLSHPTSTAAAGATMNGGAEYQPVNPNDDIEDDIEMPNLSNGTLLRQPSSHHNRANGRDGNDIDPDAEGVGELAGIYLGVLNVYITLPQFVATFISWIVFSILEPGRNTADEAPAATDDPDSHKWLDLKRDAPNAISVCLFIGGLSALIGAEATRRLRHVR